MPTEVPPEVVAGVASGTLVSTAEEPTPASAVDTSCSASGAAVTGKPDSPAAAGAFADRGDFAARGG